MTTEAAVGYGTSFDLETVSGSGVYSHIAEIDDITPPNEKADVLDATNFDSEGGYKEFILGLTDPGDVKFSMNFLPGSASETHILAAKASRMAYSTKITFPGGQIWTFKVLVLEYSPAVPVDKKMTCSVSGKVTGSVLRA